MTDRVAGPAPVGSHPPADEERTGRHQPATRVAAGAAAGLTLYLLLTSRWGSYVGVPGKPIYLTDLLLVVIAGCVGLALLRRETTVSRLTAASPAALLAVVLAAYAGLRFAAAPATTVDALRDLAPYLYAVVAGLVALVAPARSRNWSAALWAALVAHTGWVVLLPHVPGFPFGAPTLGTDATILVPRPDFDSCVLGLTAALALRSVVLRWTRRGSRLPVVALAVLALVSWYGVLDLSTRAGLLSALTASAAAAAALLMASRRPVPQAQVNSRAEPAGRRTVARVVVVVVLGLLVTGVLVSPTGARLLDGIRGGDSQAAGTVAVRREVWRNVTEYTYRSAERTAVGVGFGRNFIAESGSRAALEGSTYTNVRSPHNYLVGTFARLGVAGAVVAALILLLGAALAWSVLLARPDTLTAAAALLALSLPVVALLGVVLESPFGAVPYFWALGHLAAVRQEMLSRYQR